MRIESERRGERASLFAAFPITGTSGVLCSGFKAVNRTMNAMDGNRGSAALQVDDDDTTLLRAPTLARNVTRIRSH